MKIIKKSMLRDDVRASIRESILNNELKAGDRIVETKIAKQLGVSQSPVREAIRELELMGLVENKPFSGCIVKELSKKDLKDAYDLRAYIEAYAIREATDKITQARLKEMRKLLNKMEDVAAKGNSKDFVELDIAFHGAFIRAADNALLDKVWNMVYLAQWTFITVRTSKMTLPVLAKRHEDILISLEEHNCEKASVAVRSHFIELESEMLHDSE
jgi:DNA-binding GntR family transcriptional regulator